jgi:hypothetical protein
LWLYAFTISRILLRVEVSVIFAIAEGVAGSEAAVSAFFFSALPSVVRPFIVALISSIIPLET